MVEGFFVGVPATGGFYWMNTALVSLALAGILNAPSWQTSYVDAQRDAVALKKPIAVVFAPGPNAWSKVIQEPRPAAEVTKLLTDQYVCVMVDTQSDEGKRLAQTFQITTDRGLVISDRTGSLQAFWHQGELSNESMTRYLTKFADPTVVVTGTETLAPARPTVYQQPQPAYFQQPQPGFFQQPAFAPSRAPANC
jgi:hypothetical protein